MLQSAVLQDRGSPGIYIHKDYVWIFSPRENTGQQHSGLFLSVPILAEIIHVPSMVSGLTIVTGLSCLPSISLLSSALSKHWAVGRGQPLPWALCDSGACAWNTVARSSRGVAAWLLCLEVRDEQIRWPGCLRGLLGAFSDSD